MTPEEIKERIEELRSYEQVLTRLRNEIWEEKMKLMDEYERLVEKDT